MRPRTRGPSRPRPGTSPAPVGPPGGHVSHVSGDLWAIVLAGGEGTPLAAMTEAFEGRAIPKQFAAYGTGRTFLQRTMDRAGTLVAPSRTVVVVSTAHVELAREQLAGF